MLGVVGVQELEFRDSKCTSSGFKILPQLRALQILSLKLNENDIASVELIGQCSSLRELTLGIASSNPSHLSGVRRLTALKSLAIQTDGALDAGILKELNKLRNLRVICNGIISPEMLSQLPLLCSLSFEGSVLSRSEAVYSLDLTRLEVLALPDIPFGIDEFAKLAGFDRLGSLSVQQRFFEKNCVSALARMGSLRHLSLENCENAHQVLPELLMLKQLRVLIIRQGKLHPGSKLQLECALPNCSLLWK